MQLTLKQILAATCHWYRRLDTGAYQVFADTGTRPYFHCSDYIVSSAVSGPSLILVPRAQPITAIHGDDDNATMEV